MLVKIKMVLTQKGINIHTEQLDRLERLVPHVQLGPLLRRLLDQYLDGVEDGT